MAHYTPNPTDIAVIGLAGRFPGAANVGEFWRNLRDGVESVTYLSDEDLRDAGIAADVAGDPDYVRAAYLLKDADRFDASFFGYNPREARFIDPQQRVLLECAWNALEDAGYADSRQRSVGVFAGSSLNTYLLFTGLAEKFKTEPVLTLMSNDKDFLATRVGYKLQLEGPCVTVQTACATSLVALHQACQSILAYECDMALAGGVCVKVPLRAGYLYREGGMLSRDGHCRAFDASATGTIFGSGVGMVVLKRYTDALRDGDRVDAIIRASAINNDGARKASFTAPSVAGIAEVVEQALDFAAVKASRISYVECHGTGTALGDPIEVHALTKAFRGTTAKAGYCGIGSVKTNIGHLEAASGIASFIKVVLSLRERYLPRSLHFHNPNPALSLPGSPFFVNADGREWMNGDGPRMAAVNSLGVGGTNANVIVQEAPLERDAPSRRVWHVLPIAAKSAAAAASAGAAMACHLDTFPGTSLADAAYTLSTGRTAFDHRDALFVSDRQVAACEAPVKTGALVHARARSVVLVFGNEFDGSVAETLAQEEPWFAGAVADARVTLAPLANSPFADIVVYQFALAELWRRAGLAFDAVIGDGIGSIAAALAANAATPERAAAELEQAPRPVVATYRCGGALAAPARISLLSATPAALESACRDVLDGFPAAIFIPVGTSSELSTALAERAKEIATHPVLQPLARTATHPDQPSEFLMSVAQAWKLGAPVDFASFYSGETRRRVGLPVTDFERQRYWF